MRAAPRSTSTAATHLHPNALSRMGCLHLLEGRSPRPSSGTPSARAERPLAHPPNSSGDNWHLSACSPFLHLPSPPHTETLGPSVTGSPTNTLAGYHGSESPQAQQKRQHQKSVSVAWHGWGRVRAFGGKERDKIAQGFNAIYPVPALFPIA